MLSMFSMLSFDFKVLGNPAPPLAPPLRGGEKGSLRSEYSFVGYWIFSPSSRGWLPAGRRNALQEFGIQHATNADVVEAGVASDKPEGGVLPTALSQVQILDLPEGLRLPVEARRRFARNTLASRGRSRRSTRDEGCSRK